MRFAAALILWQSALITAFVVVPQTCPLSRGTTVNFKKTPTGLFMATKDEEDTSGSSERTSFEDAGNSLIDQEDNEKMEAMGDFDSNPAYETDKIEKMRAAIKARTQDLGLEKSKISQQYIDEAYKRARQAQGDRRPGELDLSQISSGDEPGSKNKWDESLPTMMYNPEDELTEEEQAEADTVGQLPIFEQAMIEVKASKWPDLFTVVREVIVMFLVVAVTAGIIVGWDGFLREFYSDLGLIPRPEDIPGQLDDLDLPEGFTNNMNEEDLAKITDEMNKASKSGGASTSSPSVNALLDSNNPDL